MWQIVQSQSLGQVEPLALAFHLTEGLPGLVHRSPGIVQCAAPVVLVLVDCCLALLMRVGVTVGEREVGRIDGRGMPLVLNADTCIGNREIGGDSLRHGDVLDGVVLLLAGRALKRILEEHVGVEGIVFGAGDLLGDTVIERCRHLCLVGEELSEFEACGKRYVALVVGGALADTALQSAEALRDISALHVHGSEVRELYVEVAVGSPSS